jgi:GT2 family glycosyltransferase
VSQPTFSRTGRDEQPDRPVLSVVVVNYNSWLDVERLTRSLAGTPEFEQGRCELIVVDNASSGPVPDLFLQPPRHVHLLMRTENGGFAVGVNAGWRVSRGRWLLLLNPDVIVGPDLPGAVLARIEAHEARKDGSPGIIGFALRNPDGTRQPSVGAEPGLFRSLCGLLRPRPRRKYQSDRRVRPGPVPWVTGALTLVDAGLMAALGGMDEDFFLYYEEVALCRSARDLGRRVEFDPAVEVVHLRPLQNRPVTPGLRLITRHSKLLYYRKHLPRWQFLALCRIVAAEAVGRELGARLAGRDAEVPILRRLGALAARLRRGEVIRGRTVRDWARDLSPAARMDQGHEPIRGSRMGPADGDRKRSRA